MYTNKKQIASGYKPVSQFPLDDRSLVTDLVALANLGTGDKKAYEYYEGMLCYVRSEGCFYEWKEDTSGNGVIGGFTYPANIISNGITYSNRTFDFVRANFASNGVIADTYANISVLKNNEILVPYTHYFVTDRADAGIVLLATSNNTFALEAQGIFLNPDFQATGDYTETASVTGLTYGNTQGVWDSASEPYPKEDVVFWNGLHYHVVSANPLDFVGTNPVTNTTAYKLLPKSATNVGYIKEVDIIYYDFDNDFIKRRIDRLDNSVNENWADFQWGNATVTSNTVLGSAYVENINQKGGMNSNTISNNVYLLAGNDFTGQFTRNYFGGQNDITLIGNSTIIACRLYPTENITFNNFSTTESSIDVKSSTIEDNIDMSDVTVFAANTITIPISKNYIGIFKLVNNKGQTITSIVNLPSTHKSRFYVESGNTQTFDYTAVGAAVANNIIANTAVSDIVVGRTDGADFVELEKSGTLNKKYHSEIAV